MSKPKVSLEEKKEKLAQRKLFANRLKLAKSFRNMSNDDIMQRANQLGVHMGKITISQHFSGRYVVSDRRVALWAEIFEVDPFWLKGNVPDAPVVEKLSLDKQCKNLDELSRLYMKLTTEQQQLILGLVRQLSLTLPQAVEIVKMAENVDRRTADLRRKREEKFRNTIGDDDK